MHLDSQMRGGHADVEGALCIGHDLQYDAAKPDRPLAGRTVQVLRIDLDLHTHDRLAILVDHTRNEPCRLVAAHEGRKVVTDTLLHPKPHRQW